ncbi:hypothetical protein NLI96_g4810 [Meripilus lineatus]|uniref:F-box domain-containing protein n=1 Tax=Meripilus lineatus TaxID=2056292 RepID=A0AAD5V6H0_9APHY|nr:hypothetical protein NLI96_g4810 [Physisporinus lineatus]
MMKTQSPMLPVDAQSTHILPRIPVELQDMVIHSLAMDAPLTDAATLASCALTCRDWYRMVAKVLYIRIHIFGRRNLKLLERTLKEKHAQGHEIKVQSLSVHDITPDERTSLAYLHTPLSSMKLCVKELLITGPHCSKDSTFPFQRALLADLLHFKALQHLQLYQVKFQSLDDLRRVLAAIPDLRSVILRDVSWNGAQAEFKPLFNTTSWQLSHISLSHCSSNLIAPLFWAMPPKPNFRSKQKRFLHPTLCDRDIIPILELAKFILGQPQQAQAVSRLEEVVEPICWEWRHTTNDTGQWTLECCIEKIDSLESSTSIYFLCGHHTSISVHGSLRVVGLRISIETQLGFPMDSLDTLLCEFEALEMFHLNFAKPSTFLTPDWIIRKLPRRQRKVADQSLSLLQGLSTALSHEASQPCCVETRKSRAYTRMLILQSLYQVKDSLLARDMKEESIRAGEGILAAQRELVLVNPAKHGPSLLDALDYMADANRDFGNTEEAIKHAKEAVEICRQLDKPDVSVYSLHLAEELDRVVTYLCGSGSPLRELEATSYCREGVQTWRELATSHNFEKHAPQLGEALDRMSTLLSKSEGNQSSRIDGSSTTSLPNKLEITDYQREAVDVWRKLAAQDASQYLQPLAQALSKFADGLSQGTDFALKCRLEAVSIWRTLAAQDIDKYADPFTLALDRMAETYLRLHDSAAAIKCQNEALDIWRDAAARNPTEYYPRLASELEKMADWASRNGFYTEAIDCRREEVNIWRKLTTGNTRNTHNYVYPLTYSLDEMAEIYLRLHDSAKAKKCRNEVVDVWRDVVAQNSQKSCPHVAWAWGKMADWALQNQNHKKAMDYRHKSVVIWRKLAAQDSDRYSPNLIMALYWEAVSKVRLHTRVIGRPTPDKTSQSQTAIPLHGSLDSSVHPLSQHSDSDGGSSLLTEGPRESPDLLSWFTPGTSLIQGIKRVMNEPPSGLCFCSEL